MLENEVTLLHRFARTGDAGAFSEVVRRHAGLVYGACLRILADRDRAADAVQDTFFQLLRNAENITGSVPAWLHRVATRRAIDVVRRDSSMRRREREYAANKPCEVRKWQDISGYVDEGMSELDEQTQEILIQHFFEGRSMVDIAADKEVSQPTVSRRIESGIAKLRERLRKRGIIVAIATLGGLLGESVVEAAPALVLKELGKMALVGGTAAVGSGVGSAAAASGTGAKAAVGVLAGVKAKVITAAAVTAVGVGGVATYQHVTRPVEPVEKRVIRKAEYPELQRSARTSRIQRSAPKTTVVRGPERVTVDTEGVKQRENIASSVPVEPASRTMGGGAVSSSSSVSRTDDGQGGAPPRVRTAGGGGIGSAEGGSSDAGTGEPMGYGGYYGGGYGSASRRAERPKDPNSPDGKLPENRP
ncbi:MAG: RNA polymerase sigma factor [Planctomycetota bacterium]